MPEFIGSIFPKENDLVMVREQGRMGYTDVWYRVKFVDNDETFVGEIERKHWCDYHEHEIGEHQRRPNNKVQRVYKEGEQFCYGDKVSICTCVGLCKDK